MIFIKKCLKRKILITIYKNNKYSIPILKYLQIIDFSLFMLNNEKSFSFKNSISTDNKNSHQIFFNFEMKEEVKKSFYLNESISHARYRIHKTMCHLVYTQNVRSRQKACFLFMQYTIVLLIVLNQLFRPTR